MPILILSDEERIGTSVAGKKVRLERVLGRGGMGTVFEGLHTWTGRRVAVKLLKPMFAQDPQTVSRFLHEAQAASKISHPNVVEVLDMGSEEDSTVYLVLELLQGEPLASYLTRRGKISIHEAVDLLSPIMDALAVAHSRGIVHRDLKPDNVFLSRDGAGRLEPKLLDFGIAKLMEAPAGHVTQTGVVIGTPLYMSPEQAGARRDIGPPADIWSMAVVVYEAITGKLPYAETSTTAVVAAILTTPPTPLSVHDPTLPRAVCEAVERALRRNPRERYATITEFRDALVQAAAGVTRGPVHPAAALAHTLPGLANVDAPTLAQGAPGAPAAPPSELTPLPPWLSDGRGPTLDAPAVVAAQSQPAAVVAATASPGRITETPMSWTGAPPGRATRGRLAFGLGLLAVAVCAGIGIGVWVMANPAGPAVQAGPSLPRETLPPVPVVSPPVAPPVAPPVVASPVVPPVAPTKIVPGDPIRPRPTGRHPTRPLPAAAPPTPELHPMPVAVPPTPPVQTPPTPPRPRGEHNGAPAPSRNW